MADLSKPADGALRCGPMTLLLALHALAATLWVGGMFFAYMILRPSAGPLDPPVRLPLWHRVFSRFFPWVWASVATLLVTGYAMYLGATGTPVRGLHVHVMQATGNLMMLLFAHLYFAPWKRMRQAVAANDLPAAGRHLNQIRLIVGINLVLGAITVVIGASGRWWGAG
jgi:uncharacterized membrane protein